MNRRTTWGRIGLIAQIVFTATWLVAPTWQGLRYSVPEHSISDMYAVTAPGGAIVAVVFTLCGAATMAFLVAGLLPHARRAGWTGVVAVALFAVSIFGVGDLLSPLERLACRRADAGCSAADQLANPGGMLDSTLSTIGVAAFIAGGFFVFAALRKLDAWQSVSTEVLVLTIITTLAFIVLGVAPGFVPGIVERVVAVAGAGLLATLALKGMTAQSPPPKGSAE